MKVKICGITRLEDALAAVDFGADALGFIFAPESPRRISFESAAQIIQKLPPFITTVGVFTEGDEQKIEKAIDQCGIDMIQFHGDFSETTVRHFSRRAIQVIRVKSEASLKGIKTMPVRSFLLDTYDEKMAGGSGRSFSWALARQASGLGQIILAGGLTPDNVEEAIRQGRPYAVDVSSGVEARPGKKDHPKMKQFIDAVKEMKGVYAATE